MVLQRIFINEFKRDIEIIKNEFNYSNLGHAFVHFCIKLILEKDDEEIADYCSIGASGHDYGIDAIVPDENIIILSILYKENILRVSGERILE